MATEHLMLNFLVAEATEKQNWSNNAYMFKDGKVLHRGRQVSVTGQLPAFSFLQGKSCLNSHWSSQIVKCCSRDFKELPLIVFKEAPRQYCNSCLAMLTFLFLWGKVRFLLTPYFLQVSAQSRYLVRDIISFLSK